MASSGLEFWQRFSALISSGYESEAPVRGGLGKRRWATSLLWMIADVATILITGAIITLWGLNTSLMKGAEGLIEGTLIRGHSMAVLLSLLSVFTVFLILTTWRMHLYDVTRGWNILHEQRVSAQACLTSGLLLTGMLYLVQADVRRSFVLMTVILVTIALGGRRLIYRIALHRRYERGVDTRNVLIVGTGAEAQALRNHLESIRHLGYTFKGFVEVPAAGDCADAHAAPDDVVGTLEMLFPQARKHFVDEIFFTTRCDRETVRSVREQARLNGVDLRIVPDLFGGLAWNIPIEYIGQFPTIPLHYGHVPKLTRLLKRGFDIVL